MKFQTTSLRLIGVALLLSQFVARSRAGEVSPWMAPVFRAVSEEYRALSESNARLHAELSSLPPVPTNQQSAQLGFQILRFGSVNASFIGWVEIDLGRAESVDAIVVVPVDAPYRELSGVGYGFPVRFRVDVTGNGPERKIADFTEVDFPNPGVLPIWMPSDGASVRRVRITMTKPWNKGDNAYMFALGEVMVMRGNRNLATGLPASSVRASESIESLRVWSRANLIDGQSLLGPPVSGERSPGLGYHAAMADSPDQEKWVAVDLGESFAIEEVRLIGANVAQFPGRPGFGFPPRFKIEVAGDEDFRGATVLADETTRDFPNPASNPVTFPGRAARGRFVRVTATKLWERAENFAFSLAELQVYAGNQNVALGKPVHARDTYQSVRAWLPQNLTDGFTSERKLVEWPEWLRGLSRRREVLLELARGEAKAQAVETQVVERLKVLAGLLGVGVGAATLLVFVRARDRRRRELDELRQRIASDLHDEIGSNLGTIALLSEMAGHAGGAPMGRDFEEINRIAKQTADSMRDMVTLMRHPAATFDEFAAMLRQVASAMLAGLEWELVVHESGRVPALGAQRHLLLALKETLHNIRKHAGARRVTISLVEVGGVVRLEVADDGAGFNPAKPAEGHGLASLRQRARALEGELRVESEPGAGAKFVLTARLRPNARS